MKGNIDIGCYLTSSNHSRVWAVREASKEPKGYNGMVVMVSGLASVKKPILIPE